ncbi:MAG: multiheme c-type cytochrome, partial [Chitinophagaceae bacterium]
ITTAHYLTSQPATEKTILGSFDEGKNIFNYNQLLLIKMHRTDGGLFQSVFYKGEQKKDFRFGLVTGSGAKGQTYLYWQGNKLFQMPISYFTAAGQWANSPGFPSDKVMFDKPITTRCLECHATYAGLLSEPDIKQEEFDKQSLVLGVDCEKCHGAGAKHVDFQTANPAEKTGKYIIKQAALSRQLQLDMCRLCHDGSLKKTTPSFQYKAGEDLANYFSSDTFTTATVNTDNADVHGNQFGLLRASKCFQLSNMTCNTCHSPHENERGKVEVFSQRCQGCHKKEHLPIAGLSAGQLNSISNNCIDCHMPSKQSRTLTLYLKDKELPAVAMVRSHYISNYPEEVKKYVEGLKKGK